MGNCTNNTSNINKTFIIEPTVPATGGTPIFSACTAVYTNNLLECGNDGLNINNKVLFTGDTIEPYIDSLIDLGAPTKRFRNLNTVNGIATIWSANTSIITPELQLGDDFSGNTRTITANNSIIQDDCLNGGVY